MSKKQLTNSEKVFKNSNKLRLGFASGTLSKDQLWRIPNDKQVEYVQRELDKKYKKHVTFGCFTCSVNALYDSGYVTDEELNNSINQN